MPKTIPEAVRGESGNAPNEANASLRGFGIGRLFACFMFMVARTLSKVLHVEDEQDIRVVVRLALEEIGGLVVEQASDGHEAVAKALAFDPDLILLDVMMPGLDGPATLRELRRNPRTASIPIIFMTAKIQGHEVLAYRGLGALDVISKPFDPMTLAEKVREIYARVVPIAS